MIAPFVLFRNETHETNKVVTYGRTVNVGRVIVATEQRCDTSIQISQRITIVNVVVIHSGCVE
jgi:hypothetical protein